MCARTERAGTSITQTLTVKKIGLVFLATLISFHILAQKGWEAGPWVGASWYFGDLNTSYNLGTPGLAAGILARYNFNERLALKFSAGVGKVEADDARSGNIFERARNLSFESSLVDVTAQFEFSFLPYIHGSKENYFSPYIFLGLTGFHFNPKARLGDELYELRALGTEGQFKGEEYYSVHGGLAFGMGMKLDLSYEWSLNVELGVRQLFTDYLDDVSTVYPDRSDLLKARGEIAVALSDRSIAIPGANDGPIGEEGRQRGNSTNKDAYVIANIALVYYFGDLRCPDYGKRKRKN